MKSMILALLLTPAVHAEDTSNIANTSQDQSMADFVNTSVNALRSGKPVITGVPNYQKGIIFSNTTGSALTFQDGTTQNSAALPMNSTGTYTGAVTFNSSVTMTTNQFISSQTIKGWAAFNAAPGAIMGLNSVNVTSVTYHGVGDYSLNWTLPFSSTAYAVIGITSDVARNISVKTINKGAVRVVNIRQADGNQSDPGYVSVLAVGQ